MSSDDSSYLLSRDSIEKLREDHDILRGMISRGLSRRFVSRTVFGGPVDKPQAIHGYAIEPIVKAKPGASYGFNATVFRLRKISKSFGSYANFDVDEKGEAILSEGPEGSTVDVVNRSTEMSAEAGAYVVAIMVSGQYHVIHANDKPCKKDSL